MIDREVTASETDSEVPPESLETITNAVNVKNGVRISWKFTCALLAVTSHV
jgi:hypothetical protein